MTLNITMKKIMKMKCTFETTIQHRNTARIGYDTIEILAKSSSITKVEARLIKSYNPGLQP